MELDYTRIELEDDVIIHTNPKNIYNKNELDKCCLTCRYAELLPHNGPGGIGCWHASDECGEPDHRWCIDYGDRFRCTDWVDKDTKQIPVLNIFNTTVCRCDWDDYFDFRIICKGGAGHIRVSFYPDQVVISDLFVNSNYRNKGYGTALLNYADDLIEKFGEGKQVNIIPLTEWEKNWYKRRGYNVIEYTDE